LRTFFAQWGELQEVFIFRDKDNGGKSKGHAMVTFVEAKNALAATQDQKKTIDGRQCVAILASEGQAASQANKSKQQQQQQFTMHPSAQAMQFAAMMSNPYAAMMGASGSGAGIHGAPAVTGAAGAAAAAAAHPQYGASASLYSALGSQYGAAAPQPHHPQQPHPMQQQQQQQQQQQLQQQQLQQQQAAAAAAAAATTQASAAQTAALWQLYYGGAGAR